MTKDIRWKQRFQNFENAYNFLKKSINLEGYDELQRAGLLHSFEFTFELGWKTLKDYLEQMGITTQFPRQAIKEAFFSGLIENGRAWIKMLDKRSELTHTYNEDQAKKTVALIKERYFPCIEQVYNTLKKAA